MESLAEVEEKVEVEVARTEVRCVRAWLEHPSRATLSHVPHHILRRLLLGVVMDTLVWLVSS